MTANLSFSPQAAPVTDDLVASLEERARAIRRRVVQTIAHAGVGHPGGSLSAADILAALYFHVLRVDPHHPDWPDRDRFVASKGHCAAALYATFVERGFIPVGWLDTFGRIDSRLQVHPDMQKVPGVEISTGALGQGFSVAIGMALAARLDGQPIRVFVLLGDGESQEGQVWEAAMFAAHHHLDNLTAIVDYNQVQLLGPVAEIMDVAPLAEKWRAFGWHVLEIDGHDLTQIVQALGKTGRPVDQPVVVIAHTVKGKGVSFMEGQAAWHGRPPNADELAHALQELA